MSGFERFTALRKQLGKSVILLIEREREREREIEREIDIYIYIYTSMRAYMYPCNYPCMHVKVCICSHWYFSALASPLFQAQSLHEGHRAHLVWGDAVTPEKRARRLQSYGRGPKLDPKP